jgi:hypothetical protein
VIYQDSICERFQILVLLSVAYHLSQIKTPSAEGYKPACVKGSHSLVLETPRVILFLAVEGLALCTLFKRSYIQVSAPRPDLHPSIVLKVQSTYHSVLSVIHADVN